MPRTTMTTSPNTEHLCAGARDVWNSLLSMDVESFIEDEDTRRRTMRTIIAWWHLGTPHLTLVLGCVVFFLNRDIPEGYQPDRIPNHVSEHFETITIRMIRLVDL